MDAGYTAQQAVPLEAGRHGSPPRGEGGGGGEEKGEERSGGEGRGGEKGGEERAGAPMARKGAAALGEPRNFAVQRAS